MVRTADLYLHAGSKRASYSEVAGVITPPRTSSWVPLPHHALIERVRTTLDQSGLHVVNESHALGKNGNRYFGLLQVANGVQDDDFGLVIGIRNSHDKTFPASLACGAAVFVCDNLSFSGEVVLGRKHTVHIERDLPQVVSRAIGKLSDLRQNQTKRFDTYKGTELSTSTVNDILIQSIDAQVLPVTKLPDVLREWRRPSHDEFDQLNAWRLFNAYTEILKGNLDALVKRTTALHGILDAHCGLIVDNTPQLVHAV